MNEQMMHKAITRNDVYYVGEGVEGIKTYYGRMGSRKSIRESIESAVGVPVKIDKVITTVEQLELPVARYIECAINWRDSQGVF